MKEKYKGQIEKLSERLKKLNIPHTVKELFDGPDCIKFDWCDADIICHHFSYGGKDGLFEVMGKALMTTMEQNIDSVAGNIPMEDAVNRIKKAWDSNKNEVSKVLIQDERKSFPDGSNMPQLVRHGSLCDQGRPQNERVLVRRRIAEFCLDMVIKFDKLPKEAKTEIQRAHLEMVLNRDFKPIYVNVAPRAAVHEVKIEIEAEE